MQAYIKEVGRGKKGARDLTMTEAQEAAALILDGKATDAQIGAFFMAERIKSEALEELHAFVEALRERAVKVRHDLAGVLDCAGPYDGRSKSFAATLPVAVVLAACGVPTVLHGTKTLPPKFGVTLREILEALQVPVDGDAEQVGQSLREIGVAFVDTERFVEPLQRLRRIREELGVRTLLSTAEKYTDVAQAAYAVAGVFHTSALEKSAELLLRLGYSKAMVVQGVDGSEDVPTTRPSALYVIQNGEMVKHLIDPRAYGLSAEANADPLTVVEQAGSIEEVLQGGARFREMVLLNAGLRLWFVERAASIEEGVELARNAIDSGKAREVLAAWRGR